jgi:phosphopantothenoylcysteine decarboxylase/phosphopantothenate--cysteine ligase
MQDLAGEHLLVTTGATREAIDPVRFLSNRSSGRMGFAIGEAAQRRGARVTVVAGATTAESPKDIAVATVSSAAEMRAAVMNEIPHATVFVGAAAVTDFRPVEFSSRKIKKSQSAMALRLEPTPDILREAAATRRGGLLVIGFAAETENVMANAREKLRSKNLDAIVVNDVTRSGAGFDSTTNEVTIISRDRKAPIHVPLMPKTNIANIILDEVVHLRARGKRPSTIKSVIRANRKA